MGEPMVAGLKEKGVDAAMVIPKEGAIGWLDCWEISAGTANLDLAHAWIDAVLEVNVGTFLTEKYSYGNAVDEKANQNTGFTYGDKLTFLETPEDFNRRVEIWNEVKAAI
jgi:spermidine/putrescine-binding protein